MSVFNNIQIWSKWWIIYFIFNHSFEIQLKILKNYDLFNLFWQDRIFIISISILINYEMLNWNRENSKEDDHEHNMIKETIKIKR